MTEALNQLNYSSQWLDSGLISQEYINEQWATYQTSVDKHPEHYRFAAFCHILATRQTLTDEEVTCYLELTQLDPDNAMATSALIHLLQWPGLTDQQAVQIKHSFAGSIPAIQKIAAQRELLKQTISSNLTSETFDRCLASNNDYLQRQLLTRSDLTEAQMNALKTQGANRAIRNMATEKISRLQRKHI